MVVDLAKVDILQLQAEVKMPVLLHKNIDAFDCLRIQHNACPSSLPLQFTVVEPGPYLCC